MSDLLIIAANDLIKRERPCLVVATGLLFRELSKTADLQLLKSTLVSSSGGTWGQKAAQGYGHPVLRSTNMRGTYVDVEDAAWRNVPSAHVKRCALEDGDILVIKSSGSNDLVGKAALFVHPGNNQTYLFSNFTLRLRPDREVVLPEFLAWFLRSPQALMWRYEAQHTTVGLRNLKTKDFLGQGVPVPELHVQEAMVSYLDALEVGDDAALSMELPPPLDEQRRIVARVEELAALIEEAQGLRAKAQEEAGRLVSSAAGELFLHLLEQYETRRLDSFDPHVTSGPRGWKSRYAETGIRFYRAQDIGPDGRLQHQSKVFVRPPEIGERNPERALLDSRDLMLVITGATVGRCAVFPRNCEPGYINQHVALCRLPQELINPHFVLWSLRSPFGQEQLLGKRYGETKPGLNLTNIRMLEVPFPPMREQRRIVAHLDDLQAQVDELTALQDATQVELDALLPSVLDRAFRGEL